MSHIDHLEDWLLEEDHHLNDILSGLHTKYLSLSLKYDGNPSFVVGQGLVAFKNGYLKNEKEIFKTVKDFERISDINLRSKMMLLWRLLSDQEELLFGDFLFNSEMINEGWFQPNTVKYYFGRANEYELGVAIHKGSYRQVPDVYFAPIFPLIDYHFTSFPNDVSYYKLTDARKKSFKRWVNKMIKENGKLNFDEDDLLKFDPLFLGVDNLQKLLEEYAYVIEWKNRLLAYVQVFGEIRAETEHEGLVVHTEYGLLKLVDRLGFSKMNFARYNNGRQSVSKF